MKTSRARTVKIDTASLRRLVKENPTGNLTFEVFPGETIDVAPRWVEIEPDHASATNTSEVNTDAAPALARPGDLSLAGPTMAGSKEVGWAAVTTYGDDLIVTLVVGTKSYVIHPLGQGRHGIFDVAIFAPASDNHDAVKDALGPDGVAAAQPVKSASNAVSIEPDQVGVSGPRQKGGSLATAALGEPNVIDVLVVYERSRR